MNRVYESAELGGRECRLIIFDLVSDGPSYFLDQARLSQELNRMMFLSLIRQVGSVSIDELIMCLVPWCKLELRCGTCNNPYFVAQGGIVRTNYYALIYSFPDCRVNLNCIDYMSPP